MGCQRRLGVSPGDWGGCLPFSSCPLGVPQLGVLASSLSHVSSAWDLSDHLWETGPTYYTRGPASPQDDAASQALAAGGEALAPVTAEMPKTLCPQGQRECLARGSKSPAARPPSC